MKGNLEVPRRGVLLFVAPIAVLIAVGMFLFFASDEWTPGRILVQIGFTAIAIGLVVATVSPRQGWWGLRLVTFTIFAAYLAYLVYELWFSGRELTVTQRQSQATPFNSILGFLFFGVPCLIYTLWGSTWGRLGYVEPEKATRTDVVVYLLARGAAALMFGLSILVLVVGIWRAIGHG